MASEKRLYELNLKRQNRAYLAYESGSIPREAYNERKDKLESDNKQLKEDIKKLELKIANDKLRQATRESFVEAIDQLNDIFRGGGNIVAQKRFLQSIINKIIISESKIEIKYWLDESHPAPVQ